MDETLGIESLISELEQVVPNLLGPAKKVLTTDDGSWSSEMTLDTKARQLAEALEALGRAESSLIDVVGQLKGLPRNFDTLNANDAESLMIEGWEAWETINGAMENIQYALAVALIQNSCGTSDWNEDWAEQFAPFQIEVTRELDETLDKGLTEIKKRNAGSVQTPVQFLKLLPFLRFGLGKSTKELRQLLHIKEDRNADDGRRTGYMAEYEYHKRVADLREHLLEKRIVKEAEDLGWSVALRPGLPPPMKSDPIGAVGPRDRDEEKVRRRRAWRPDMMVTTGQGLDVYIELKYFGRPGRRPRSERVAQDEKEQPEFLTKMHNTAVDQILIGCSDDYPGILVELSDHHPEPSYWLVNPGWGDDEPEAFGSLDSAVEAWQLSDPPGQGDRPYR